MGAWWSHHDQHDRHSINEETSDSDENEDCGEDHISDSSSEDEIHRKHPGLSPKRAEMKDLSQLSLDCTASDAVLARPIRLTLPNVLSIENELELYEKVSLIYLLFDNAHHALQQLVMLISNDSKSKFVISHWAKYHEEINTRWQEKLVEALCIIQNYKVLISLGFDKKDLKERFLPNRPFAAVSVRKMRKVLYHVCEELNIKETNTLIDMAEFDFVNNQMPFEHFEPVFLEIYLLHWETLDYIKINNVANLCRLLKQIEKIDLCEKVKELLPSAVQPVPSLSKGATKQSTCKLERTTSNNKTVDNVHTKRKKDHRFDKVLDDHVQLKDILNMESIADVTSLESNVSSEAGLLSTCSNSKDDRYPIDYKKPGTVLIINQKHFYVDREEQYQQLLASAKLEVRSGTDKDKDYLVATFKSFGFNVSVEENLTHTEMIDVIEACVRSVTEESSLFVCIMSHGEEGIIYGVNSCKVDVSAIQNVMCRRNIKNLQGKPKILILQSCQGTKCQNIPSEDDIETDSPGNNQAVPVTTDVLTFWATVPGYAAIRHKRRGSWFIQSLCEKMMNFSHEYHFDDICTKIIRDVSSRIWTKKVDDKFTEDVAMVPIKQSTLTRRFYLPPKVA